MATYTVRFVSQCGGGEHIKFDVFQDGTKVASPTFTRTDLLHKDLDWRDVLTYLMREAVKAAGSTTAAQARTAVEAKEWVL